MISSHEHKMNVMDETPRALMNTHKEMVGNFSSLGRATG